MYLKAPAADFLGRFREIVSDPLNLLIQRHPLAGTVEDGFVYLHNGHKVALSGPYAYYDKFSDILIINRGVHEPLEEYVFQELLKVLPDAPCMLELGAYWGHYSMWLQKVYPDSQVCLVEPEEANIRVGRYNFKQHGYQGEFIQSFVGTGHFEVDQFLQQRGIPKLNLLHSDIQGYEQQMLTGCTESLKHKLIDYVFVSTHSQQLHSGVVKMLNSFDYNVEVSSDFDSETTSFDGFVFASSPLLDLVFADFNPLGRTQIIESSPNELIRELIQIEKS